jgi:hypothetical protein
MKTENGGRYYAKFMCIYFCNLCGELLGKGDFVREIGQKTQKGVLLCKTCNGASEHIKSAAQA